MSILKSRVYKEKIGRARANFQVLLENVGHFDFHGVLRRFTAKFLPEHNYDDKTLLAGKERCKSLEHPDLQNSSEHQSFPEKTST